MKGMGKKRNLKRQKKKEPKCDEIWEEKRKGNMMGYGEKEGNIM
jgi:hypothetical protein